LPGILQADSFGEVRWLAPVRPVRVASRWSIITINGIERFAKNGHGAPIANF
jgi:hypothetical protein